MSPPEQQPGLREPLLQAGFDRADVVFASGVRANNKLDLGFETINQSPVLCGQVVRELGRLAADYKPDLFVPVPTGANGYGRRLGHVSGIHYAILNRDPATREIFFKGNLEMLAEKYHRIVIVEDVLNNLTTTRAVMSMPGISERVVGVVGIWDRGKPQKRPALPDHIGLASIIQEFIAPKLRKNSKFWEFAA